MRRAPAPGKGRAARGSGSGWTRLSRPARSPKRPSRLPYRGGPRVLGVVRPDDPARPGSAQLGGRGVHSAVAPTLWPLGPQRAAPGSARAGGGCYARNVRVSGSPSGSKRTTNNLSARRPPPPSAALRLLPLPPPGPRLPPGRRRCGPGTRPLSSVPGRLGALQDALRLSRLPTPAPRSAFGAAGDESPRPLPSPKPFPSIHSLLHSYPRDYTRRWTIVCP